MTSELEKLSQAVAELSGAIDALIKERDELREKCAELYNEVANLKDEAVFFECEKFDFDEWFKKSTASEEFDELCVESIARAAYEWGKQAEFRLLRAKLESADRILSEETQLRQALEREFINVMADNDRIVGEWDAEVSQLKRKLRQARRQRDEARDALVKLAAR